MIFFKGFELIFPRTLVVKLIFIWGLIFYAVVIM